MILARQRTAEDEPRARMLGGYEEPIGKQLGWGAGKAGQLALPVDKFVHGGAHTALREVVPCQQSAGADFASPRVQVPLDRSVVVCGIDVDKVQRCVGE